MSLASAKTNQSKHWWSWTTHPVGRAADNVLKHGIFTDRLIRFPYFQSQKKALRDCRLNPVSHPKPQQQAHERQVCRLKMFSLVINRVQYDTIYRLGPSRGTIGIKPINPNQDFLTLPLGRIPRSTHGSSKTPSKNPVGKKEMEKRVHCCRKLYCTCCLVKNLKWENSEKFTKEKRVQHCLQDIYNLLDCLIWFFKNLSKDSLSRTCSPEHCKIVPLKQYFLLEVHRDLVNELHIIAKSVSKLLYLNLLLGLVR